MGVQLTGTTPAQKSMAVKAKLTVAPSWPAGATTVKFVQPEITGALVSITARVCVQLALLPARSVAVQVQVITLLHEEFVLLSVQVKLTATLPSQLSMAVTLGGPGGSR